MDETRTDLAAALSEVERLREENTHLRECWAADVKLRQEAKTRAEALALENTRLREELERAVHDDAERGQLAEENTRQMEEHRLLWTRIRDAARACREDVARYDGRAGVFASVVATATRNHMCVIEKALTDHPPASDKSAFRQPPPEGKK